MAAINCPEHGLSYQAYCPDCAFGLPRATFSYGVSYGDSVGRPPQRKHIYGLEQVRECIVKLEPVQTRMRVRGVDHYVNVALNALKQAEIHLEEADG